ncbi:MAG: hypothetical protein LW854_02305 [Rubrivivax sp.]|nr:hypothetical protein [Rubrivivax sp.]
MRRYLHGLQRIGQAPGRLADVGLRFGASAQGLGQVITRRAAAHTLWQRKAAREVADEVAHGPARPGVSQQLGDAAAGAHHDAVVAFIVVKPRALVQRDARVAPLVAAQREVAALAVVQRLQRGAHVFSDQADKGLLQLQPAFTVPLGAGEAFGDVALEELLALGRDDVHQALCARLHWQHGRRFQVLAQAVQAGRLHRTGRVQPVVAAIHRHAHDHVLKRRG